MDDETQAALETEAPAETVEAASDTGAPATPPEGFIEQERYENLRSEFNRKQALWDRALQGDEAAASELGLQFAEEEVPDQGDEEEPQFQDPRVDAMLQREQAQQEQAILGEVSGHIDTLLKESKVDLPQRLKQAILTEAWTRGGGPAIQPNVTEEVVKEWISEYEALKKAAGDEYVASKRAPHVSRVGQTGATEAPFRDDMTLRELTRAAQEQARLLSDQ